MAGRLDTPEQTATRATEPERPAEVIYLEPSRPESEPAPRRREEESARANTDERQNDSAANAGITDDSKAAKKAALAQMRAETEASIEQGQERGFGYSR